MSVIIIIRTLRNYVFVSLPRFRHYCRWVKFDIVLPYSILITPAAATFTLEGVPAGTQADVEKALNSFYIQG